MSKKQLRLIIFALFAGALILRIMAAWGSFSMDEIWSLEQVTRQIRSPVEIFTKLRLDNNHILNSFYMFLLGEQGIFQWYRLLSLLGGMLAVYFGYRLGRRFGQEQALIVLILFGFSFPMVFYSSEARGYGPLMGCVMAALFFSHEILVDQKWDKKRVFLFWIWVILGFLAHLTFFHFYSAVLLWSIYNIFSNRHESKDPLQKMIKLHMIPVLFFLWYYWIFISKLQIGGGPVYPLPVVLNKVFAYSFGVPYFAGHVAWTLAGAGFLGGAALMYLYQKRSDLWILYVWGIVCSPMILLLVKQPPFLYVRYFLVSILFYILLISHLLAWLVRVRIGKVICLIFIAIFLAGQFKFYANFFKYGRGQYAKALTFILEQTGQGRVTVGSDFDLRNAKVIRFYRARIKDGERIQYISAKHWNRTVPQYYFVHRIGPLITPADVVEHDISGKTYRHRYLAAFPYSGDLSGWHWYLYERI